MSFLRASHITHSFGSRVALRDVGLAVDPGHRAGLVGENGAGKSTLLRILAGVLDPDDGSVERPAGLGYLPQEFEHPAQATVGDVIESALAEVRALEAELERAGVALADGGDEAAFAAALARAEAAEVWDADARSARTLAGLRLDGIDRARAVGTLSGGQRTRLGLAELLIRRPDALLLDEPTNHLDDDAADFLAAELRALPGAVVLASHDRVFLNDVCTEIWDLDPVAAPLEQAQDAGLGHGATRYGGSYRDYLVAKRAERERWEQLYESQQAELDRLRKAVGGTARQVAHDRGARDNDKFIYAFKGARVQAQVAHRVRDARSRLDALSAEQVRKPAARLRFAPAGTRRVGDDGGTVLSARSVVVPGRLDMAASGLPSLDVPPRGRILLTGDNGAGKSTLLHVLAGDLRPASGSVVCRRGARVGLLEQDALLDDDRTPRQLLALAAGHDDAAQGRGGGGVVARAAGVVVAGGGGGRDAREGRVEAHGLLAPRDLDRPARVLSVGQQRRVVLAMLLTQAPDVLLLDEPTNHLSLVLADELVEALADWPGAVVLASHDRWLRRHWTEDRAHLAMMSD